MNPGPKAVTDALQGATHTLLSQRHPLGYWEGELSSSALSTATALVAIALAGPRFGSDRDTVLIRGFRWLLQHQHPDGGWGDTVVSASNLSTTTLVWAAFALHPQPELEQVSALRRAEDWLTARIGTFSIDQLARSIIARYGKDRTFSVPILTHCALAGRLGRGAEAWRHVIPLPFELASLPPSWFAAARLPVVSYALPALIAIGQVRFHQAPPRNPLSRWVRQWVRARTLRVLEQIQPDNGGFLEATPLTSFVTMSLLGAGQGEHPVVDKGLRFLRTSQRKDGSWPIDTNLRTWLTTLGIQALPDFAISDGMKSAWKSFLLGQQYTRIHPYTQAAPGGWAWTDLPGGVPDADDTAGALLALHRLDPASEEARASATLGVRWLLDLQNRDGGVPTFCRGWGTLPFDRSSTDITAHAMRALHVWRDPGPGVAPGKNRGGSGPPLDPALCREMDLFTERALGFLVRTQKTDGTWVPLWFGNENHDDEENPMYGTARVTQSLCGISGTHVTRAEPLIRKALGWMIRAQHRDGGFGGGPGLEPTVEETALAVETLARAHAHLMYRGDAAMKAALDKGLQRLVQHVKDGTWQKPAPIGFYFAKLWYFEKLYPQIFTVGALRAAAATNGS